MGLSCASIFITMVALILVGHPAQGQDEGGHQMLGRVQQLERELRHSMANMDLLSRTHSRLLPQRQESVDPDAARLEPREGLLEEDISVVSLPQKMMLNVLDKHFPEQAVVCGPRAFLQDGIPQSALQALPICPQFLDCVSEDPSHFSQLHPTEAQVIPKFGKHPVDIPDGALGVCWSGFADLRMFDHPSVPLNCQPWYSMSQSEIQNLIHTYMDAKTSPLRHPIPTEEEALMRFMERNPSVTCAPRVDFTSAGPVAYTVWRLRNVYVSGESVVFNSSTVFQRLGYRHGVFSIMPIEFPRGSRGVKLIEACVNLAYQQQHNFYHTIADTFPLFFIVAPILHKYPGLPVILRQLQVHQYSSFLAPLVGVPLHKLARYEAVDSDLFHVRTLFQPTYQHSGRSSRSLWRELRRRHLLHPQGVPLFNSDWSPSLTLPLSQSQMASFPSDWVVAVAKRPGKRRALVQHEELMQIAERVFSPERVVVFSGDLSILQARELFRRVRVLVGVHGAALSNMVFMPSESSVVEIRPNGVPTACLHWLAEACSLKYHLLFANGTFRSMTSVDMDQMSRLLKQIASTL